MFKFIIIGDTGTPLSSTRSRQILLTTTIHRSSLQTKTLSYHRSLVSSQNDHRQR